MRKPSVHWILLTALPLAFFACSSDDTTTTTGAAGSAIQGGHGRQCQAPAARRRARRVAPREAAAEAAARQPAAAQAAREAAAKVAARGLRRHCGQRRVRWERRRDSRFGHRRQSPRGRRRVTGRLRCRPRHEPKYLQHGGREGGRQRHRRPRCQRRRKPQSDVHDRVSRRRSWTATGERTTSSTSKARSPALDT